MVRGTGKFKQKRGGGRSFSKNMTLDENGTAVGERRGYRNNRDESEDDDSEEEESSEEEEESESEEGSAAEKLKKKEEGGEDEDDDLINPNHVQKKLNISDLSAPRELSRKEREAKEKKEAQDRYWKLHVQGKTDQAKSDLARLNKIRAERDAAQAKRKAEAEAKSAEAETKRQAQMAKRK
ncbi:casein kinase substrate phosphoprotein PP28-domain-containing protein [Cyathus striatus]|nr:casein kinase substrate phosphoprotein PP28-domain-containing protein [Cyathus striatus]